MHLQKKLIFFSHFILIIFAKNVLGTNKSKLDNSQDNFYLSDSSSSEISSCLSSTPSIWKNDEKILFVQEHLNCLQAQQLNFYFALLSDSMFEENSKTVHNFRLPNDIYSRYKTPMNIFSKTTTSNSFSTINSNITIILNKIIFIAEKKTTPDCKIVYSFSFNKHTYEPGILGLPTQLAYLYVLEQQAFNSQISHEEKKALYLKIMQMKLIADIQNLNTNIASVFFYDHFSSPFHTFYLNIHHKNPHIGILKTVLRTDFVLDASSKIISVVHNIEFPLFISTHLKSIIINYFINKLHESLVLRAILPPPYFLHAVKPPVLYAKLFSTWNVVPSAAVKIDIIQKSLIPYLCGVQNKIHWLSRNEFLQSL